MLGRTAGSNDTNIITWDTRKFSLYAQENIADLCETEIRSIIHSNFRDELATKSLVQLLFELIFPSVLGVYVST